MVPVSAAAYDISGQSRTYILTRELADGTRLTPLYEYLDLRLTGTADEPFSFSAGGWYRYDLQGDDLFRDKTTGDLQYAYLTLRTKNANAALSLGRVVVTEGAAVSQLDGAYGRTDLRGGFTIAAFGGVPVEAAGDTRGGDSVYGGRLSHSVSGISVLGASYLKEKNDSQDAREEAGVDLWLRPFSRLEVAGVSSYNAGTDHWSRHNYSVSLGPFSFVRLNLEGSKTWYREYFTAATLNAFTFPSIDPNEVVTSLGGSAVLTFSPVSIIARYTEYGYEIETGSANQAGVTVAYAGQRGGAGASYARTDGTADRYRYDQQRIYGYRKISRADVALDVVHVDYEQAINAVDEAWSGSLALGYAFTPKARLVVDGSYAENPDYDHDLRGMAKFIYAFDLPLSSPAKAPRTPPRK
jgi:hypothetical protein